MMARVLGFETILIIRKSGRKQDKDSILLKVSKYQSSTRILRDQHWVIKSKII